LRPLLACGKCSNCKQHDAEPAETAFPHDLIPRVFL
jgi:hypothetical protein